jgi:hypothetical protein
MSENDDLTQRPDADPVVADATGSGDGARPSPSAAAARRARRIGGVVTPPPSTPKARPDVAPASDAKAAAKAAKAKADAAAKAAKAKARADAKAAKAGAEPAKAAGAEPAKAGATASPAPAPRRPAPVAAGGPNRYRWYPSVALGVVVVVLVVLGVFLSRTVWWAKPARNAGEDKVVAAAKNCFAAVASYDYRDLAKSKSAGLACATGKFKTQYAKAMDTTVKQLAGQTKTIQSVQIENAGIKSVSSNGKQWVLVMWGSQKVANSSTPNGRQDLLSGEVTMTKVGGKWLVSLVRLTA